VLSRFDALADQAERLLDVDEAVIDGEVIAADETGRPQFYEPLRVPRSASYVAFDILQRHRPARFAARRASKAPPGHCFEGVADRFRGVIGRGEGRELFELMCTNDLEGIVAKRLADPYDTRVRWLKIKNPDYSQKEGRAELFNRAKA
jgi:ATP-dependent DNA ligase